ncbi:MAG: hypothetical protein J6U25_01750, partial [Clostridia bacterium]|nr:hypothetical protein [Clostridia bacterium]
MKVRGLTKFRFNLWFYFVLYTLIIIAFMWVFQLVLYETLYQREKFNDLADIGEELSDKMNYEGNIDGSVINEWLNSAVAASEAGITSYLVSNNDGETVIETIYSGYVNSDISKRDTEEISLDGNHTSAIGSGSSSGGAAPSSGGSAPNNASGEISISEQKEAVVVSAVQKFSSSDSKYLTYTDSEGEENYLVYGTAVRNEYFNGNLVLLTTDLTLRENVRVIQIQLVVVSVFVIVLGFFLSMYISSRISK